MKSKFIVWFRLAAGRCDMLGAKTKEELVSLIRDLPPDAEICSLIGRRTVP